MEPLNFAFAISEFDVGVLSIDATLLKSHPSMLTAAIVEHLTARFKKLGGKANVVVRGDNVAVTWFPSSLNDRKNLFDFSIQLLQQGAYKEAEPILRGLLQLSPRDPQAALNLGMMLSDQRRLEEAIDLLELATEGTPTSADAWNALG